MKINIPVFHHELHFFTPLKKGREILCVSPKSPMHHSPMLYVRGLPFFCPALVYPSTIAFPVLPVCADFKGS